MGWFAVIRDVTDWQEGACACDRPADDQSGALTGAMRAREGRDKRERVERRGREGERECGRRRKESAERRCAASPAAKHAGQKVNWAASSIDFDRRPTAVDTKTIKKKEEERRREQTQRGEGEVDEKGGEREKEREERMRDEGRQAKGAAAQRLEKTRDEWRGT